jgi:O-antigen/teichoic acid export membrane protein
VLPADGMLARDALPGIEVKHRAIQGVALVGARFIAAHVLGIVSSIVLARLLTPHDFGIVALGWAVLGFGQFIGDGGIGIGLIRGRHPPERADLEAMLGFQLLLTSVLVAGIVAIGSNFGVTGRFIALASLALPFTALRAPGFVVLERNLAYRRLATLETAEGAVYYACGLPLVALGAGIWGLGVAMVVRAITASALMLLVVRAGRVAPRLTWSRVRGLLGFGAKYQGVGLVWILQDQGLSFGIASIANAATLGLWSLTVKIMQVPLLLYQTLARVAYPALARLLEGGEDLAPSLERGTRIVGVTCGLFVAVLVATSPALIPLVFGSPWRGAIQLVPWVGLALLIGGPVTVTSYAYLFARGEATTVLNSVIAETVAWFALTFSTLPAIGVRAVGVGMVGAAVVEIIYLTPAMKRLAGANIVIPLITAIVIAIAAATAGWIFSRALGANVASLLGSAAVTGTLYLAGAITFERRTVHDTVRLLRQSIRSAPPVAS